MIEITAEIRSRLIRDRPPIAQPLELVFSLCARVLVVLPARVLQRLDDVVATPGPEAGDLAVDLVPRRAVADVDGARPVGGHEAGPGRERGGFDFHALEALARDLLRRFDHVGYDRFELDQRGAAAG